MFAYLRERLVAQPPKVAVRLFMNNPYYEGEYMEKLISHLEKKAICARAGLEDLSPSDLFALEILKDSSYLPTQTAERVRGLI